MTRDINQLSKIAEKFDESGLFGSSEAVDTVIKHLASKLTSDEYRAFTKKIRNKFAGSKERLTKSNMASKLIAIASQFDAEGNFAEADKITKTVEAMLEKKSRRL